MFTYGTEFVKPKMASISKNRQTAQDMINAGKLVPAPNPIADKPPTPVSQIATNPLSPNPYLRTPLPASYSQQPDQQRQWQNNGSIPQVRIPPTSLTSNPIVGAQAASQSIVIQETATNVATVIPPLRIPINKQTGTSYIIQPSDLNTLVTFSNNSGGTIFLPSPSGNASGFVQLIFKSYANPTSPATGVTGNITLTTGNAAFVILEYGGGGTNVGATSVTDTLGNTYTPFDGAFRLHSFDAAFFSGLGVNLEIWYSTGITGGTTQISAAPGLAGGYLNIYVLEYAGIPVSSAIIAYGNNFSGTTASSPLTLTTTATGVGSNDIVIGIMANDAGTGTGSSLTTRITPGGLSYIGDQPSTSPVANVTMSFTGTVNYAGVAAVMQILPAMGALILPTFWYCWIENTGSGTFTFQSLSKIDGASANLTSLAQNKGLLLVFDGANYYTMRG
jgi:hypothetical protein